MLGKGPWRGHPGLSPLLTRERLRRAIRGTLESSLPAGGGLVWARGRAQGRWARGARERGGHVGAGGAALSPLSLLCLLHRRRASLRRARAGLRPQR